MSSPPNTSSPGSLPAGAGNRWLLGLLVVAPLCCVGAVVAPWLLVAGRSRNGLASAELLISVAEAGAPQGLRVAGILWYLGAFAALLAWATVAVAVKQWLHRAAVAGAMVALLCWLVFAVWAGSDGRVLMRWPGPVLGLAGTLALVAASVTRVRLRSSG